MGLIRILPFALLIVPLAEIAMFILVGSAIGVLPTIALVIITAVSGATLLRVQGLSQLARIQRELALGGMPGRELVHGAMMMVAGVLLLTPGFITDTLGLLLFIPKVREAVFGFLAARVSFVTPGDMASGRQGRGAPDGVIDLGEGDYHRENVQSQSTAPEPTTTPDDTGTGPTTPQRSRLH